WLLDRMNSPLFDPHPAPRVQCRPAGSAYLLLKSAEFALTVGLHPNQTPCPETRPSQGRRSLSARLTLASVLVCAVFLGGESRPVRAQTVAVEPALTPIYAIQGDGPVSPLAGQRLDTKGLVTGVTSDGFYLQD